MSLFLPEDLLALAEKNLGLRLTANHNEFKIGGTGDAIPLSHLAGANDIIEFVTLSFLPELPRQQMEAIYAKYKEIDVRANTCMPRLILHYAAQHNIGDAKERLSHRKENRSAAFYIKLQCASIEAEAKTLLSFYQSSSMLYPLKLVVSNLPYLAQELAYNFNEKLQLRLKLNWDVYATSDDMDYLFLTDSNPVIQYYTSGYDFNHYPLGKIGNRRFQPADILKQVMFLGGGNRNSESEKTLEECIFESIKSILKRELHASLRRLQEDIESKLSQHQNYPADFTNACNEMVALVDRLQENKQLSSEESIRLMQKTADLIDNPADYKEFLTEAKNYRMVAGGRLSAYMMLIAGWAAKIMTLNFMGDAWITRATEQLDFITTTEECAQIACSESSFKI